MGYTLLSQAIGTLFMNQVSQKPYPIGWYIHHPPPPPPPTLKSAQWALVLGEFALGNVSLIMRQVLAQERT